MPVQIDPQQLIRTKYCHAIDELYLTGVKNVIIAAFARNLTVQKVCEEISSRVCKALAFDPTQQTFMCAIVKKDTFKQSEKLRAYAYGFYLEFILNSNRLLILKHMNNQQPESNTRVIEWLRS